MRSFNISDLGDLSDSDEEGDDDDDGHSQDETFESSEHKDHFSAGEMDENKKVENVTDETPKTEENVAMFELVRRYRYERRGGSSAVISVSTARKSLDS
jgi:hypothetical protein